MDFAWFHRHTLRVGAILLAVAVLTITAGTFAGDIETAKQKLEQAKDDLKAQNFNSFEEDMKAANEFLDGVPDGEKAPVLAELSALQKQADPQIKAFKSKTIVERVTRDIDSAASEATAVPERALTALKEAGDRLNSDEGKKYVDPATATKLQARIAGLQQMALKGVKKRVMDSVTPLVADLEKQVAANPFKDQPAERFYNVSQSLTTDVKRARGMLEPLPPADPEVKAITARLAALDKQIEALGGNAEKSSQIANLAKTWKGTQEYFAGWDKETTGPKWEPYSKTSSQEMSALLMPKTIEAISRTKGWLEDEQVKKAQEEYKDDPSLKATISEASTTLDMAAGKLSKAYNGLLDEAEKLPPPAKSDFTRDRPGRLADDAKRYFAGTKYLDANVARATKLQEKWDTAAGATAAQAEVARQAQEAMYKKLSEQATAAWPTIADPLKAVEGFSPDKADAFKGKTIRIHGRNRMGWDYTGQFDYAVAINGLPVAGNYDPNVKAAVADVLKRTSQGLPEEDAWDVIGVVEGSGRIFESDNTEVRDSSTGRTVGKVEGKRPVDVPVLRIIALHAGPVAVGPGGAVTESGVVQSVAGGSGSAAAAIAGGAVAAGLGILGWIIRILSVLILLAAAVVAFIKAKAAGVVPAPVAAGPGQPPSAAGNVLHYATPALAGNNIAYVGLIFMILGVLKLLGGCIIFDLLPGIALIAAGAYAASDLLKAKGILKEPLYLRLQPLGVPIAAATAVIAVLHLLVGGWWVF